jgi:prophage antirepressor-like protein
MQSISVFVFEQNSLDVIVIDGQPWFNASQVAKALGYANPSKALQDNVSGKYNQQLDLGKPGKSPNFISEPGLYQLIMRSSLPAAEKFQDWVFEEVLPSIRETGSYTHQRAITSPSSFDALEYAKKALSLCGLESPVVESWGLVTLASKIDTTNREIYLDAQKLIVSSIELPETLSTVTEVCSMFEASGVKMTPRDLNKMLCELGLQVLTRDAKGRIQYQLTSSSEGLGKLILNSTNGGKNIPQLKWYATKLIRAIGDRVK